MQYNSPEKYRLVETIHDPVLEAQMKAEKAIISAIQRPKRKTFIDLGAGYGRYLPYLAPMARNVIEIEISLPMIAELKNEADDYQNVRVVEGNIQQLSELLSGMDVVNPVLLMVQNTLGTIEGDYKKVLSEMKKVAVKYNGEMVISIFRQKALRNPGMKIYKKFKDIAGEPDLKKTDFKKGLFVSKTGYISKWWSDEEIKQMKEFLGGRVVDEASAPEWCVMHLDF